MEQRQGWNYDDGQSLLDKSNRLEDSRLAEGCGGNYKKVMTIQPIVDSLGLDFL